MKLPPSVRLLTILWAFAVSAAIPAAAKKEQPPDTPEDMQRLLAEVGKNYREASSFRIEREMVSSTTSDLQRVWAKDFSATAVAPGNRYRREDKQAYNWMVEQSDGTKVWIWYPWRKQYSEQSAQTPSESKSPGAEPRGAGSWFKQIDRKLASGRVQPPETIMIGGRKINCMVLIGPPSSRPPSPDMEQYTTYWIDRDRKVLVKEQAVMRSKIAEHKFESVATTTYKVVEINPSLPDSLFKFVPDQRAERVEEFESGPVVLVGKAAPSLKLKTLDGKDFDLASLRGKAVIVDFWATWCMPCRESMPFLAKLNEELRSKGLEIVSVSKDDDPADAKRFVTKGQYLWTQLSDASGTTDKDWGRSGIPRLLLVSKDGKVLYESENGYDQAEELKFRVALHKMDPTFPAVADGNK